MIEAKAKVNMPESCRSLAVKSSFTQQRFINVVWIKTRADKEMETLMEVKT